MEISHFIQAKKEQIIQEWSLFVSSQHQSGNLSVEDINQNRGVREQMLSIIANGLESPQTGMQDNTNTESEKSPAEVHGSYLIEAGFGINEIVEEYRTLRAIVVRLWGSNHSSESSIESIILFNAAIDRALSESVKSYTIETEKPARILDTMLSASPDPNYILDLNGTTVYVNKSACAFHRKPISEIIDKNFFDLNFPSDVEQRKLFELLNQTKEQFRSEVAHASAVGAKIFFDYIYVPVLGTNNEIEAVAVTARDVTERRISEEQAWHNANYDWLTGLPNRRLFIDRLEQEIISSQRSKAQFALLFIDLDHFKAANDLLGHEGGDLVLKSTASQITSCVRKVDTVARLGGDEFTVILRNISDVSLIKDIVQKILQQLAAPITVLNQEVVISSSIGVVRFPNDGTTRSALLRNADHSMYAVKNAGRNNMRFFSYGEHPLIERLKEDRIDDK